MLLVQSVGHQAHPLALPAAIGPICGTLCFVFGELCHGGDSSCTDVLVRRNRCCNPLGISNLRFGQRVFAKPVRGVEPEGEDQPIGARRLEFTSGRTVSLHEI
jgi:hypothetical protein